MAIAKAEKKGMDVIKEEMWKIHIRAEDDSTKAWHANWGWIMEEYRSLQEKLKEKSDQSKFLDQILEHEKEDPRKLINFPETTNQEYGWIASQKDFQLGFGPDTFKPQPLPTRYHLPK